MTKSSLCKLLNENQAVTIEFTKLDGTNRVLLATNYDYEAGDDQHLTVWDGKNGAWRTVIVDRITSVEVS